MRVELSTGKRGMTVLLLLTVITFGLTGCLDNNVAGTTEVGNTNKVSGIVKDSADAAVAYLPVYLVNTQASVVLSKTTVSGGSTEGIVTEGEIYTDVTEKDGSFSIPVEMSGKYNLVTGQGDYANMLYQPNIEINTEAEDGKEIGEVTLTKPAVIRIYVYPETKGQPITAGYLVVKGTLISQYVDREGFYDVEVPAGKIFLDIIDTSGNYIKEIPLDKEITIKELEKKLVSKTDKYPKYEKSIINPAYTFFTAKSREVSFSVEAGDSAVESLVYFYDWGDGTNSGWVAADSQSHSWNVNGKYPVIVTARSRDFAELTSEESDTTWVIISDSLPKPKPALKQSAPYQIGVIYDFYDMTDYKKVSNKLEYRIDWGDNNISVWNNKFYGQHAWNLPGSYSLKTQVRDQLDTAFVSPWSEPVSIEIQ